MSSIRKVDPQQRMTNILMAGNLYKAHKIDKGIQKVAKLQEVAMAQSRQMHNQSMAQGQEMISNQRIGNQLADRGNKIAETQLRIQLTQAQQIEKTKLLKNTFFEISEEVEDVLKEKKITNIEKYFRYGSIKATLESNGIDTDITDDFSEKKFIRDTIKKVENQISKAEQKFNKKDKKDLEEIYQTLEIDEESEIQKLSSSDVVKLTEKAKELKEWYNKAKKICGASIFYIFLSTFHKINKKSKSSTISGVKIFGSQVAPSKSIAKGSWLGKGMGKEIILPVHLMDSSFTYNLSKYIGLENPYDILGSKIFFSWYTSKFKEFYKELGFFNCYDYDKPLEKIITIIQKGDYKSLFGGKKTALDDLKKWDKTANAHSNMQKHFKNAFFDPFPKSIHKQADEAKKKIGNLKKDIEDEKTKLKKIFKNHPFVKIILSNR
tara:strand:- start:272 stop:1576 length:1305 start_codon:yes stop_codon:yes gene_type:complete